MFRGLRHIWGVEDTVFCNAEVQSRSFAFGLEIPLWGWIVSADVQELR